MSMREILEQAEKVKPIAEINGLKIVTFEDQMNLASADLLNKVDLGIVEFNPDGSIAQTPTKYVAVNKEVFFNNRYRKVGDEYWVVMDKEAINGQETGRVPQKQVFVYVIGVDKDGKPKFKTTQTITDTEFIEFYTEKLSIEDMEKIYSLVTNVGSREAQTSKPIFK